MKKTMIVMLLCAIGMNGHAAEKGDTLVIKNVKEVKIETRDKVQRIELNGTEGDPDFRYTQRISIKDINDVHRESSDDISRLKKSTNGKLDLAPHMFLGLNQLTGGPSGYEVKAWPSIEIALGVSLDWTPYGQRNMWSIGAGIGYRYYRMSNTKYWTKDPATSVMYLEPYDNNLSDTRCKLRIFSISIPLTYSHYFDDKQEWGFSLGAILNFNTGGSAYQNYSVGDEDFEVRLRHVHQRPVTVDAIATVHLKDFPSLYVKYSPSKFFKDNLGPEMHQLSFGFCF